MNAKLWVAGFVAVLLIDGLLAFVLSLMVMAEDCATNDRWQCSESVRDLLRAGLIAVPALYVTVFVRAWISQRESGTPS
jgi:TRAP-type C4-dicarboxylate transport system permease large subunit